MKHYSLLASAAALAAILILPSAGLAQGRTGGIFGIISDETGARLPGVTVTVESPAHIQPEVDVTDVEGHFLIRNLTPGLYTLTAELSGFATIVNSDLRIDVSRVWMCQFFSFPNLFQRC